MSMARKYDDLKKLSDNEFKKEYDKVAERTVVGLNFFLEEIIRREQRRQARWHTWLSVGALITSIIAIVISATGVFVR